MNWFIADGSQSFGPYSSEQLREFAKAGKVVPQSYVRRDDQEEWIEASRVNGLFEGVLTIAPPAAIAVATNRIPQASAVVMEAASQGSGGNVVAAVCSFFIPGLGQLAQGRFLAGVVFFVAASLLWFVLLGWVVHLFAAYDAATYGSPETANETPPSPPAPIHRRSQASRRG